MAYWNAMLIDRDRLFSAALATLLSRGPFRVGCEVADVDEAMRAIARGNEPDLVVLAIGDALALEEEGIARLRQASNARVVVLANAIIDPILTRALAAGADACLDKAMSSDSLLDALHLVMLGEVVYPMRLASLLIADLDQESAASPPPSQLGRDLSGREVQILRCLLAGESNKTIARHLSITESTVKMHFKNVMRKIHAQNRTQAAVWALQNGLGPPLEARPLADR